MRGNYYAYGVVCIALAAGLGHGASGFWLVLGGGFLVATIWSLLQEGE